jgi:hypothetical protein
MDITEGKFDGGKGKRKIFRKEISTQRLYIFGIPSHWVREESHVIGVYMRVVVEVG